MLDTDREGQEAACVSIPSSIHSLLIPAQRLMVLESDCLSFYTISK